MLHTGRRFIDTNNFISKSLKTTPKGRKTFLRYNEVANRYLGYETPWYFILTRRSTMERLA